MTGRLHMVRGGESRTFGLLSAKQAIDPSRIDRPGEDRMDDRRAGEIIEELRGEVCSNGAASGEWNCPLLNKVSNLLIENEERFVQNRFSDASMPCSDLTCPCRRSGHKT